MDCFSAQNHVVLATVDGDKPRLRPMTLVVHDGGFYFATGTSADKVKQLKDNPEVEFILQWKEEPYNCYIRVRGKANKVDKLETVTELYNTFEYFNKLWESPSDPTLVVYQVEPSLYDYMEPGAFDSVQVKP